MAKFFTPSNTIVHLEDDERRYLSRTGTIIWDCTQKGFILNTGKSMADYSRQLDNLLHDQFSRNDDFVYGDLDDGA